MLTERGVRGKKVSEHRILLRLEANVCHTLASQMLAFSYSSCTG
jgi:hypothetical protein